MGFHAKHMIKLREEIPLSIIHDYVLCSFFLIFILSITEDARFCAWDPELYNQGLYNQLHSQMLF